MVLGVNKTELNYNCGFSWEVLQAWLNAILTQHFFHNNLVCFAMLGIN